MAVPQPQSRNPFLSPQSTGPSLRLASVSGPSLHSAFQDLSLAPPPTQQQPLTPQSTAATRASNNPFLDRHTPTRPLDDAELRELEGTVAPAADEGARATPQQPALGGPLPLVETAPAPAASSSLSRGAAGPSSRRVAEGNEDFRDDDEALRAAIEASLADAPPGPTSTSAPPLVVSLKATEAAPPLPPRDNTAYAPPPGPPPLPSTSQPSASPPAPPVDPPPAYTPSSQQQESTVDVGPRYPPFATQAPMEPQRTGWSEGGGNPGGFLEPGDPGYRPLGGGGGGSPGGYNSPGPSQGFHRTPQPPLPPRHPSTSSGQSYNPSPHPPPHQGPPPQLDPTPSSVPIIGRPFLNHGQTLVYPPAFTCWKCQNTGWKENDPTHPCRQCWKRYGRPFSGPLTMAWNPPPANYQRPLGGPHRPTYPVGPPSQGWAGPDTGIYRPVVNHPPPGSVVYRPGDPRIGGALCMKCGGAGVTIGFFEDDTCSRCGGVGRIF